MSVCQDIFNKQVFNLTIDDISDFFDASKEENETLEFKSGQVSLETVHESVSALLNTNGGLLIIGAPKEKKVNGKKVGQGKLIPSVLIRSRETLIKSVASNISPSPTGIKAISFEYEEGFVHIVEVEKSLAAPHQVNKKGMYYIRLDTESKPAPHGIVEALFFKRQRHDLLGEVDFVRISDGRVRIIFPGK